MPSMQKMPVFMLYLLVPMLVPVMRVELVP
jgi:hypothetical protein